MVNENFDTFRKEQKEHQAVYLGGNKIKKPGLMIQNIIIKIIPTNCRGRPDEIFSVKGECK